MEKVLNSSWLCKMPIDKIFVPSPHNNLASDGDLAAFFIANGTAASVCVVEDDGDSGLRDAGLPLLVHELLQVAGADLLQVGDAQHEADGIQDVGFAGSIQTRYGIEEGVKARHHRPRRVRLEALKRDLLNVH